MNQGVGCEPTHRMDQLRKRRTKPLAPSTQDSGQPTCCSADASAIMQASSVSLRPGEPPALTGAALAQDIDSKCFVRNGRSIIDQRLRRRALLGGFMASIGYLAYYAAVQVESVRGRDTAMYAVPVLCYVVMACITPAATPDDINPSMEWCMLYATALSSAQASSLWVKMAQTHPCGSLVAIPGILGVIARVCVPLLGLRNPMWFWPAERCVLMIMGCLRFLQVAVQTHALLLADVAAALGFFELLPVPMAAQCQACESSAYAIT